MALLRPATAVEKQSVDFGYRLSVWWIMCSFRELKWATSFPQTGQEKRPKWCREIAVILCFCTAVVVLCLGLYLFAVVTQSRADSVVL